MPAVRHIYQVDPNDGVTVGLWIELTTGPGLIGMARTAWPSTSGKTLANYQAELNLLYQGLCNQASLGIPNTLVFGQQPPAGYAISGNKLVPEIVVVNITVASLGPPVVLGNVQISEGASKQVIV
jgi:hypothetical protein